jgi:hypothetical protein
MTDLKGANFLNARMAGAQFQGADLRHANLCGADLTKSNLDGADLRGAQLDSTNFTRASLRGCNLFRCELFGTDLIRADLSNADLTYAFLKDADLTGADLRGARLTRTRIWRSNLTGADCSHTSLSEAELDEVTLKGTNFQNAHFWLCRFSNLDLSGTEGLDTVFHSGPSSIGIETLFLSAGRIPTAFLLGVGVPRAIIDYLLATTRNPLEFYSCFISYSSVDENFARLLHSDMLAGGIRCWLFAEDATWGERVWSEIDKSIRVHDKVVVICSKNSLRSEPVLREIERALQREDQERRNVLYPVRIDDFIFKEWEHPRKSDVASKVIGDFRNWSERPEYSKALGKFLQSLSKP